ncbi:hypothetical protein QQZ08_010851 [Neonectria magnoliae]|uniref:HNH nuclease domain-containing protein n=1 Tax=Neonectria magnoliae TaxID=2732573 RepID=A0ABR1HEB1_9HYPO
MAIKNSNEHWHFIELGTPKLPQRLQRGCNQAEHFSQWLLNAYDELQTVVDVDLTDDRHVRPKESPIRLRLSQSVKLGVVDDAGFGVLAKAARRLDPRDVKLVKNELLFLAPRDREDHTVLFSEAGYHASSALMCPNPPDSLHSRISSKVSSDIVSRSVEYVKAAAKTTPGLAVDVSVLSRAPVGSKSTEAKMSWASAKPFVPESLPSAAPSSGHFVGKKGGKAPAAASEEGSEDPVAGPLPPAKVCLLSAHKMWYPDLAEPVAPPVPGFPAGSCGTWEIPFPDNRDWEVCWRSQRGLLREYYTGYLEIGDQKVKGGGTKLVFGLSRHRDSDKSVINHALFCWYDMLAWLDLLLEGHDVPFGEVAHRRMAERVGGEARRLGLPAGPVEEEPDAELQEQQQTDN